MSMKKALVFLSLLLVYGGTVMGINQNYTHIKVVFYYNNPSSYPDTGRSIQDILGGHYELKKAFFYEDIKNYRFLEAVMTEQPVIIEDFDALRIRKEFVDCLCIISLDYRIVLSFTYTERKDEYCIYNGNLIKRNKIFDDFSAYLVRLMKDVNMGKGVNYSVPKL